MSVILVEISGDDIARWARENLLSIIIIVVAALIIIRLLNRVIPAAIRRAILVDVTPLNEHDLHKRADTLSNVLLGVERTVIIIIAALMVIGELGFNLAPVIAGLGITGIAVGLGAQSMVRDAINGLFILGENQFGRGDMVKVAGVQGWVEEVNLRRTVLRDLDGTLHSVPNSEIKVSSNLTRGYSGVDLLVSLAAGTDVDAAIQAINEAGRDLLDDEDVSDDVLEAPQVSRIETTTATGLDLRITGRARPGAQWRVTSALRRRIIRAFDVQSIRFGPAAPAAPPAPPPAAPSPTNPPPPVASARDDA
ncbi:MAG: mechanosensitive ion channel family protein [Dehalococcoidia bacterium]